MGEALRILGGLDDAFFCVGRSGRARILDTGAGWNVAFADGSVTTVGFDIDPDLHRALAARSDGGPASRPD